MIIKGNFEACAEKLLNLMKTRKGVQYVLIQKGPVGPYFLYDLIDPDFDCSKAISGDMRVVLCLSKTELTTLQNTIRIGG